MVEMRVQGRERGREVWYGRDEGTGEGEGGRFGMVEMRVQGRERGMEVWVEWL